MSDDSGEPNLYEYLRSVPAVQNLVGNRIYRARAPDGARGEYVVWQLAGGERGASFCAVDRFIGAEYQVDIYGRDDVRHGNLVRAIRDALLDDSTPLVMGSVRVNRVLPLTDFDSVDPDPGLYRRTQTYTIWYAEGGT